MKRIYEKLADKMDSKKAGIIVSLLFIISLLPVIYVGMFNYATGDDYWYGVHTYRGWVENGLVGALKGSLLTVAEFYENWQGTWSTMFLFTLSPNHFMEGGYIITVFLALGLLIGSFSYLAHFYLVKKLGFTKGATAAIVCMISYLAIQYIPRTTSGIYWFNGIMHYTVPFFWAVLAIVHSHKFLEDKRVKDYIILFINFFLLGGGSYLAPLAATLTVCLLLVCQLKIKVQDKSVGQNIKKSTAGNKRGKTLFFCGVEVIHKKKFFKVKIGRLEFKYELCNLWILAAFLMELIGLAISFIAPGNNVRGGEEFGADLKWALQCIYYAIDRGIYLGEDYFLKNAVTTIVYLILAVVIWSQLWRTDRKKVRFPMPLLFVIYMNGIYWASYTPEIYSRSDVSGGVPNTYFHIFLIITFANMIYMHGWLQNRLLKKWEKKAKKKAVKIESIKSKSIFSQKNFHTCIGIPAIIVLVMLFGIAGKNSEIETTNDYCIQAIKSGQLERYSQVREEQHRILSEGNEKEVVVPEIAAPYPLLHMLLLEDENDSRNIDRAKYYNKDSVKAKMVK